MNAVTAADMRLMDVLGWDTVPGVPPVTTPPVLLSASPADNATNVAPTSDLVLNFSENVHAGSGNVVIHKSSDGSTIASIAIGDTTQIVFSGSSVVVNPTADLIAGTHYYITVGSGAVRDIAGNSFAGISSSTVLDFTTGNARTAPYDFNTDGKSDVLFYSAPDGNWSGWQSLGGAVAGAVAGGPGAVLETGGRLVVFARGADNNIWHRWQVTRNGNWSGWESVGAPPGGATSDPDPCPP